MFLKVFSGFIARPHSSKSLTVLGSCLLSGFLNMQPVQAADSVSDGLTWTLSSIAVLSAGNMLTQTIGCNGTGYVAGWIDFNRNGQFDDTERSIGTPACNGTSVTLTWTLPSFNVIKPGVSYVRLRVSSVATDLVSPTNIPPSSEVGDRELEITAPEFEVTMSSNAPNRGWYQGQSDALASISVSNVGTVGNNDPSLIVVPQNSVHKEVRVLVHLPEGTQPNWSGTLTSGVYTCTYVGLAMTCRTTSNVVPGAKTTVTIPLKITATTDGTRTLMTSVGGGFDPHHGGTTPLPGSCEWGDKHCASLDVLIDNPPSITGEPLTEINQGAAYFFQPTIGYLDEDEVAHFSATGLPDWLSLEVTTGALTGVPGNNNVGVTDNISVTISDGLLSRSLPAFRITVLNVNDAPEISGSPVTSINQDAAYSFIPTANDIDVGDVLTFSIENKPAWASFDTTTGELSGTPARADVGTTTGIVISVSDGALSASLPAFDLAVVSVNAAPVISGTPATQVDRGAAYSFVPNASDGDGDSPAFSATGLPAWLSLNAQTGEVSGTAPLEAIGESYAIELTVSDGNETASISWNLTVVLQIGDITGLWLKDGELANERFGGSLALFDATGDGVAEVYVGSPTRTVTVGGKKLKNAGGIDVLAASNGALLHRVNATVAKQRFGSAIAVVADQNSDGIEDLVVGKPFAGKGGEIALHSGDDGSLLQTLIVGGKANTSASAFSNCADPASSLCATLAQTLQGGRIGYSLAVADIDGNGGADLIVGLPQANVKTPVKLNKVGSVIVYQGLSDTPRYVINGQQAGEALGASVAVDDNYLLVGSPNFDVQAAKKQKDAGRVQLFNLQSGSVVGSVEGNAKKQLFGSAVASFNQDINSDGQPDWAVAAAGDKSGKPVKLFTGITQPAQFAEITASAPKKADAIRLAAGLDINGDGVSDLVIGLPNTKITVPFNNKTKALKNAGQVQVISGANWAP